MTLTFYHINQHLIIHTLKQVQKLIGSFTNPVRKVISALVSLLLCNRGPCVWMYVTFNSSHCSRIVTGNNTNNKSESDQEDNDDVNDNDWSYGAEKKGEVLYHNVGM